jgi:hypothetical protein
MVFSAGPVTSGFLQEKYEFSTFLAGRQQWIVGLF